MRHPTDEASGKFDGWPEEEHHGPLIWRCKDCGSEHSVTMYEIQGEYDHCPNCNEITEHEYHHA